MKSTDRLVVDSQALVVEVFRSLRSDLLEAYGNVEHTKKADSSQVTKWDVKVENTLRAALKKAFPKFGFEGEETGKHGSKTTYWVVDPIDGTTSFIRGLPFCTNMAALVHGGYTVAAVIYDFVNDILYTARVGEGAYRDGERMHVNDSRKPGNQFLEALTRHGLPPQIEAFTALRMRLLFPISAAGHTYVMLAEGKIDGVTSLGYKVKKHDNAPGMLICEEAGAVVLQYDDKVGVNRTNFIIGAPKVIERIEHSGLL